MYMLTVNADMTEGRGPMVPIAFFTNKSDAEILAYGIEPYSLNQFQESTN